MMAHVIFLQPQPDAALHRKVVGGVMHHVVKKITGEEPGKCSRRDAAEEDEEQTAEHERERNTDNWGHHEATGVFRVIVMDAVQQKMELLSPAARRLIMKNPAMHRVFHERPNENAEHEETEDEAEREPALAQREIEHERDNRQVNHQRRRRMHMGEKFHEAALEHPDGLVLIRDVARRHTIKPSPIPGPLQRAASAGRFRAGISVSERILSASSRSAQVWFAVT